jgi:indolepyruvate ferredoxin oxidoreductase beta subunit
VNLPEEYNIIVAGVGGQGVLFLSEILGEAALREGLDARIAEIHGMAQRGGSVTCHVRIGEVHSPTVMEGSADLIIGFEQLEVLRTLKYANRETLVLLSKTTIVPPSSYLLGKGYPADDAILKEVSRASENVMVIDAMKIAETTGNLATQNSAILGFISALKRIPVKPETLKKAIADRSPSKYLDANLQAFELGREEYKRTDRH